MNATSTALLTTVPRIESAGQSSPLGDIQPWEKAPEVSAELYPAEARSAIMLFTHGKSSPATHHKGHS